MEKEKEKEMEKEEREKEWEREREKVKEKKREKEMDDRSMCPGGRKAPKKAGQSSSWRGRSCAKRQDSATRAG